MKTMKKILLSFIFTLLGLGSFAQSFVLDTSFTPFFDIRNQRGSIISELVEINSGKLFMGGGFTINFPNKTFDDVIAINQDGSFVFNLNDDVGGGVLIPFSPSQFAMGNQFYGIVDTNGNADASWFANYRPTVACSGGRPFFFPDGSSLFANGRDNSGKACKIIQGIDTFPGRHIIKLTPQGLWDSTFNHDATYGQPEGFVRYDSNRIIIYGNPLRFTHYDSIPIEGMCRIYLDGTLDTTFTSPMNPNLFGSSYGPTSADSVGRLFILGTYYLKGDTNRTFLVRLLPNGQIDASFQYRNGAFALNGFQGTSTIVETPDKGYLVGGYFTHYQGVQKKSIVKVDSNGILEPQYFTSLGPDSADQFSFAQFQGIVSSIIPSKFSGYYVAGNFLKWDGQASQPIVKITGLNGGIPVGLTENSPRGKSSGEVSVFPNPTSGMVTIESEAVPAAGRVGVRSVEVYNLSGLRYNFFVTLSGVEMREKRSLDLTNLSKGVYFLKVELENGEVVTDKIVKQ
jgi:hypothetical protein